MNENLSPFSALELMLRWNHYCDTHNHEGDCILLNEERIYWEAFDNKQQAMEEIVNSREPEFTQDDGYLIPIYESEQYLGMLYVPFDEIGKWIDLSAIGD